MVVVVWAYFTRMEFILYLSVHLFILLRTFCSCLIILSRLLWTSPNKYIIRIFRIIRTLFIILILISKLSQQNRSLPQWFSIFMSSLSINLRKLSQRTLRSIPQLTSLPLMKITLRHRQTVSTMPPGGINKLPWLFIKLDLLGLKPMCQNPNLLALGSNLLLQISEGMSMGMLKIL